MTLATLLTGALAGSGSAHARELCRFEIDGLVVSAADTTDEGGMGVDISVAEGPLVLTRAAIPAEDGATRCWQLDLDGDRRFEIIVGLVDQAGTQPPRLVSFEWNGRLLEPRTLPAVAPILAEGYVGGDTLELRADVLIRAFEVRVDDRSPPERRHFRYAPDLQRWIPLQALKRDAPRDANGNAHGG